ncbi:TlyA family RNA methyltransferase [Fusibacter paucivorans]|uniref:TlyA family RNA methyltransferase n=1 Tax=Fusibacter paucivorans TaxID=76009 RepID=A0ABS5PRK7_9FIRM|nr:TlyA family RNA methyltransferase [Fusibacter paucivorans]MBS7526697.1 TlyA family RNA methyltransferase [Fusibacter paucivorans]
MAKERIDVLIVERGLIESREKAKRTIMAGIVYVDGQRVDKPGTAVDIEAAIEIRGNALPYVSRGGLKLEKAMRAYAIDLKEKRCMDIGASTGGFTDCMLQNGASHVFSVDVGYGQLDWKLRNDPRVTNWERTNIRYVKAETVGEPLDFISIDVSFISLKLVLPVAWELLKPNGEIVFLIKPQFEAGRAQVKKNGVVRDSKVHLEVLKHVVEIAEALNFQIADITYSPIKGPKGNIEFLAYARKILEAPPALLKDLNKLVESAHQTLIAEAE